MYIFTNTLFITIRSSSYMYKRNTDLITKNVMIIVIFKSLRNN